MKNSRLLVVIVILQLVLMAGQWLGTPRLESAQAQSMDAARDRIQLLDEVKSTNSKLDKIFDLLNSGGLQVRGVVPDESKGRPAAR